MMEFKCPKCGSAFFTTVSPIDRPVLKRKCKGSWLRGKDYAGCGFTWESTDELRLIKWLLYTELFTVEGARRQLKLLSEFCS